MIYGLIRSDIVIVAGQALSYFIYVRNLQLKNAWVALPVLLRVSILLIPFLVVPPILIFVPFKPEALTSGLLTNPVLLMGAIGQLALNFRFVYQWYYSEKYKTSLLPYGFWSISTWASVMVILYSLFHPIYEIEPVLLVSQTMGIVVYIRNMILSKREKVRPV
jgi:lipid-A-disaccharide synthase-like uncharacterized protein